MRILIVGCGYVGRVAARIWQEGGHSVSALTRTSQRADELRELGITPFVGDIMQPGSLQSLPQVDVVLYAVGFDRDSPHTKREIYVTGLRNVLEVMHDRCRRFVYVSSTSVYGETDGEWVDEDSPCRPESESGQICLEGENSVWDIFGQKLDHSGPTATVVRLAGIYGPGRLLRRIEQVRSAEPLAGRPDAWLNLIHVEDAATAVVAAAADEHASHTLLVSDDHPISRLEYYQTLAELLHAPEPRFSDEHSTSQRTPGRNKRCRSTRSLERLAVELEYPTARDGLQSALA